jgi:BlaI family penicillinase repressor
MDILYRAGRATAAEVRDDLAGNTSYSTVRTQLRVLEEKGHLRHEVHGLRYVYMPTVPRRTVRRSALKHLVETFFEGSAAKVVTALLGSEGESLSDEELDRIAGMVEKARKASSK